MPITNTGKKCGNEPSPYCSLQADDMWQNSLPVSNVTLCFNVSSILGCYLVPPARGTQEQCPANLCEDLRPGILCCLDDFPTRLEMLLARLKDPIKEISKLPVVKLVKRRNWNVVTLTTRSIRKSIVFSSTALTL